jgi:hypothetical protein
MGLQFWGVLEAVFGVQFARKIVAALSWRKAGAKAAKAAHGAFESSCFTKLACGLRSLQEKKSGQKMDPTFRVLSDQMVMRRRRPSFISNGLLSSYPRAPSGLTRAHTASDTGQARHLMRRVSAVP